MEPFLKFYSGLLSAGMIIGLVLLAIRLIAEIFMKVNIDVAGCLTAFGNCPDN